MTPHSDGSEHATCCATTRKGTVCGNKARFVYTPTQGVREYLCGQHVGPSWKSRWRHLRELRR